MLALSAEHLQEVKAILTNLAPKHGALAFGSRIVSNSPAQTIKVKPFADLDIALTGQAIGLADMYLLRDAMSQSQLPFRVDICHWDDLPSSWKKQLATEALK